jgi:hypothetical protein
LRGSLQKADEKKLQSNYQYLLDEIDPKFFINILFQNYILDEDDKDEIDCMKTRRERTLLFIDKMFQAGPGPAYKEFMSALKIVGYKHVVEKLEGNQMDHADTSIENEARNKRTIQVEEELSVLTEGLNIAKMTQTWYEEQIQSLQKIPTLSETSVDEKSEKAALDRISFRKHVVRKVNRNLKLLKTSYKEGTGQLSEVALSSVSDDYDNRQGKLFLMNKFLTAEDVRSLSETDRDSAVGSNIVSLSHF